MVDLLGIRVAVATRKVFKQDAPTRLLQRSVEAKFACIPVLNGYGGNHFVMIVPKMARIERRPH